MAKLNKNSSFPLFCTQNIFVAIVLATLAYNLVTLNSSIQEMKEKRAENPYIYYGLIFSGLDDILGQQEYVGYYTDKDLDKRENALIFTQAQYTLIPAILDLNIAEHEYILFFCSDPLIAMQKIQEMGATALRKNKYGVVLAKNPKYKR